MAKFTITLYDPQGPALPRTFEREGPFVEKRAYLRAHYESNQWTHTSTQTTEAGTRKDCYQKWDMTLTIEWNPADEEAAPDGKS